MGCVWVHAWWMLAAHAARAASHEAVQLRLSESYAWCGSAASLWLCHVVFHPPFPRSSKKINDPWTAEMEEQAVAYYCAHYIATFSQADVCTALACIPQLNMWDGEGASLM